MPKHQNKVKFLILSYNLQIAPIIRLILFEIVNGLFKISLFIQIIFISFKGQRLYHLILRLTMVIKMINKCN